MLNFAAAAFQLRSTERAMKAIREKVRREVEIMQVEEVQAATGRGKWVRMIDPMANVSNRLYRTMEGDVRRFRGVPDVDRYEWFIPDPIEYFPALHCHMTVIDRPTTIPEVKR